MQPVPEGPAPMVQPAPPLDAPVPAMGVGGVPVVDSQTAPSPMPILESTQAGLSPTSEGTNFVVPPTFGIDKGVPPPPAPEIPGLSAIPTERTDATAVVSPSPSSTPDIPGMTSPPVTSAPISPNTSFQPQISEVPSAGVASATPAAIDWTPPASVTVGVDQVPQTTNPVSATEVNAQTTVATTQESPAIPAPIPQEGTDTVTTTEWKPDASVGTSATENTLPLDGTTTTRGLSDTEPAGSDNALRTTGWQTDEKSTVDTSPMLPPSTTAELSADGIDHTKNILTRMMEEKKIQAEKLAQEQRDGQEVLALHDSPEGKRYRETLQQAGWLDPAEAQQLKNEVVALRGNKPAEPTPLPVSQPLNQAA